MPNPPKPATSDDRIPLSFAQQRLWFLDRIEERSDLYNIPLIFELVGPLDSDALRRSIGTIVSRHDVLRTSFPTEDGVPYQAIAPAHLPTTEQATDPSPSPEPGFLPWEWIERDVDELGGEDAFTDLLRAEAWRPFDLASGPLFRAGLYRRSDEDHVLQVVMHHTVSDGWSEGVFKRELSALYAAFKLGEPSPLPSLPAQYADYSLWQNEWLQGEVLEAQMGYWRDRLAGLVPLDLPTDRPRPPMQSHKGGTHHFRLPPDLVEDLRALSRQEGSTLFMTLMAAFQVLLHRYSGQSDIAVGTPMAGRVRSEFEGLMGMFVNTMLVRSDLSGDPTFRELLQQVRINSLELLDHADLPFEKLVEELQPERDMSRNPLFQVAFALRNDLEGGLALQGLEVRKQDTVGRPAKFDLFLELRDTASHGQRSAIEGTWTYARDLFDDSTIRRMQTHFRVLLEGIVADPEAWVGDLPLMDEDERRLLVEEWSRGAELEIPEGVAIHHLFEARAAEDPDRVAVVGADGSLTYGELNTKANQLARRLIELGVEAEALVGVGLNRTTDMVVGVMGVLKAGGAYLPLDPNLPADRLAYMLEDGSAAALVTQAAVLGSFPFFSGPVICLDRDAPELEALPGTGPDVVVDSDQLAYVLYTSGSSGRPKGVEVLHRNVVSFLVSLAERPGLRTDDVFLAVATLAFDASIMEIFGSLAVGGRVAVASWEVLRDGPRLRVFMEETGVTVAFLTPATLAMLLDAGWRGNPSVRVWTGGEVVPTDLALRTMAGCGEVWDVYGPTEATVLTTAWPVPPDVEQMRIGTALGNVQTYVLDRRGEPVPVGIPGELYIGGGGVTRGYRNSSDLTAERFVPDRFGTVPGGRLFRSGDRARFRNDGALEFMGRLDGQVKIRGLRIELGEIESMLVEHPAVRQAAVRVDGEGVDSHLVAYGLLEQSEPFDLRRMRAFLRKFLPDYMVPNLFVEVDEFPLTASGKVDRRALPSPRGSGVTEEDGYVAPRTPTEEALAAIWAEVLRLDRVGIHDDFFGLGGHSLLATQVLSRMVREMGVDIPLRRLFESSTIAELAERIEADGAEVSVSRAPLAVVSRKAPLPLSFAQQRLWVLDRIEARSDLYNIPFALELIGELDRVALRRSLDAIVARHEVLRTSFPEEDGVPYQAIAPASSGDAWEWTEVGAGEVSDADPRHDLESRLRAHAGRPFDLASGPLLRAGLFRRGIDDHVLQVVMHHTVSDGWSMGVFRRELGALYAAFKAGEASPLPPLEIQYADYAAWQRSWLQGEVLENQLGYWRGQLEGLTPLDLPTDRPRPPAQSYRGGTFSFKISPEMTEEIHELGRREGTTLFMTLLAAFQVQLHRYSDQMDIVVGTPIAGRNRSEIEGLMGMFVNTLVIRSDVSGEGSFRELLGQIKQTSLEAQAHQDLPFEKLVEELQPQRDLSRNPLFQVMFTLQNVTDEALDLPGLKARSLPLGEVRSKFDLSLTFREEREDGTPGGIEGTWSYALDLFDETTIERMGRHFQTLVEGIVRNPDTPVGDLPLLTAEERRILVEEWGRGPELEVSEGLCIHHLFQGQVGETPGRVAVVAEDGELTYGDLELRANQLARRLVELGVGPETLVGVSLPRTTDLVVAVMGILKAGGAYLPLDPDLPAERLAYMLEDGDARVIVTRSDGLRSFPDFGGDMICLDAEAQNLAALPGTRPDVAVQADHLAYVLYTSGSTGRPKGVEVTHANVVAYLQSISQWPGLTSDDVFVSVATLSFDVSVLEFFGSLAVGAKIVLASWEAVRDGPRLRTLIEENHVTLGNCTPPTLYMLLEAGWKGNKRMRVWTGSEVVPPDLARRLMVGCGEVWDLYGPTETTVTATAWRVPREFEDLRIGTPLGNYQTYVLDGRMNPVPIGIPGELYIGGVGVARGYRKRPNLTAERFVSDPFWNGSTTSDAEGDGVGDSERRLYRTGDRVRFRNDGALEFLGRLDGQVKVRGLRIELGEIESILVEHEAVRQVAVKVEGQGVGARLVAFAVLEDGMALDLRGMRGFLRRFLPDYMVPSLLIEMDELPLTPSGKVDRKALPDPSEAGVTGSEDYVAPRTETEEVLAGIWSEVLGRERVGIHDDFFGLGGHSLLATQVLSRVARSLGVELPLRTLFESPTLVELSDRIDAYRYVDEIRGRSGDPSVEEVEI